MKNLICILGFSLMAFGAFSQQTASTEDCRTKITYTPNDSGYHLTIENLMDMNTAYTVKYPGGSLTTGVKTKQSTFDTTIVAPFTCGDICVKPVSPCHYTCAWDFISVKTCGILPTQFEGRPTIQKVGDQFIVRFKITEVTNVKSYKVKVSVDNGKTFKYLSLSSVTADGTGWYKAVGTLPGN